MSKKYNNGSAWALPCILATTALVALLGFTTNGYRDWTFGLGTQEPPVSEEAPSSEEVPSTEEQPGTSEELPGSSEELPGTSEELPGTSEETSSSEEIVVPEDTAFDIFETTDNYTYDDSTNVLDLHYDSVTEKEESLYWRFQCSLNFDTNDCCLYDDNEFYITTSDEIFTITIQNESFSVANNLNGENSYWEEVDPGQYVLDVSIDMIRSGYNYYLKINDGDYLHYEDPNKSLEASSPMLKTSWGDERPSELLINDLSCIHGEEYITNLISTKLSPKEKKNSDFVISDEIIGFENYDDSL